MTQVHRVMSGIKPSGIMHIGGYMGAMKNWLDLQANSEFDCYFSVVDLHAITVPQDPKELNKMILEVAASYLACGIDPAKSVLFQQSQVKEHTELCWLLNCITPTGWLNRMIQFKDLTRELEAIRWQLVYIQNVKSIFVTMIEVQLSYIRYEKSISPKEASHATHKFINAIKLPITDAEAKDALDYFLATSGVNSVSTIPLIQPIIEDFRSKFILAIKEWNEEKMESLLAKYVTDLENLEQSISMMRLSSVGLYDYPVLMAADILICDTDIVPVGEDQTQHVELVRDIARSFNSRYDKEIFKIPKAIIPEFGARIMSLHDGTKKMSKSDAKNSGGCIYLTDSADIIAKNIKKAKTDSFPSIYYDRTVRPEISNLMTLYSVLSGESIELVGDRFKSSNCGTFKSELTDLVIEKIVPIGDRIRELLLDRQYIINVLNDGSSKVRVIADKKVREIKEVMGLTLF